MRTLSKLALLLAGLGVAGCDQAAIGGARMMPTAAGTPADLAPHSAPPNPPALVVIGTGELRSR